MKTIYDLNEQQLSQMKECYFSVLRDSGEAEEIGARSAQDVPDAVIFAYYDGMMFSDDEF